MTAPERIAAVEEFMRAVSGAAADEGGRGAMVIEFIGNPPMFSLTVHVANGETHVGQGDTLHAALRALRESLIR